ncbi:hypothetical protein AVEN_159820-1 [Araneus ventricosus]|uniref:Uncharacterized protein n=1 Tax=Araneus ventricosus TaxID=182803 RepID=A0A4Y2N0V5_ARAVE|nr:hypothetical protein AVEN_159820-1 [Araneus ventricosus]
MRSFALITSTKYGRLSRPSYTRATQSSRCCGVASIMLHFVQIFNFLSPRENRHGQEENEQLQLVPSTLSTRFNLCAAKHCFQVFNNVPYNLLLALYILRKRLNKSTQEWRYVKFHYLAVKFPVIAYITYSGPVKPNGFKTPVIAGINGFLVERYPLYVCWYINPLRD